MRVVVSAIDLLRCDIGFKMGQTKYLYVYFRSLSNNFAEKWQTSAGFELRSDS